MFNVIIIGLFKKEPSIHVTTYTLLQLKLISGHTVKNIGLHAYMQYCFYTQPTSLYFDLTKAQGEVERFKKRFGGYCFFRFILKLFFGLRNEKKISLYRILENYVIKSTFIKYEYTKLCYWVVNRFWKRSLNDRFFVSFSDHFRKRSFRFRKKTAHLFSTFRKRITIDRDIYFSLKYVILHR